MKVNLNLNPELRNKKNVNFEGYKPAKNSLGNIIYEFNYPFDDTKYDCYLELYNVVQDEKTKYYHVKNIIPYDMALDDDDEVSSEKGIQLKSGVNKINLARDFGISERTPFAYHYKLYPKGQSNNPIFRVDAGNVIDKTNETHLGFDIYNVVTGNGSYLSKGGAMKLVVPDSYNVSWVYDTETNEPVPNKNLGEAQKSVKNMVNKIGGSLAGLEKDVEAGKFNNYRRIISTPIFTDDSLTSHAYWNKNCFQTALSLGNINNYASLQRKMFAKGLNFVSDGAFVNEGLEGIHFKHILKWGDKSPYFYWFRIYALQDSPFTLGIFGKDNKNIAQRLVNGQNIYYEDGGKIKQKKNPKYDSKKPTYIQIYDKRLVKNPSKLDPSKLIESYDNLATDNPVEINNHNDTVIPYSFPIREKTYAKNMENLIEYNKNNPKSPIKLDSFEATRILTKFENFEFEEKFESGVETWDANVDIIKLNYAYSHTDTMHLKQTLSTEERKKMTKLLQQKNMEVQDYAISSGKYWTKKTNQILLTYIAQNIKNSEIQNLIKNDKDVKTPADAYYKLLMQKSNNNIFPETLKNDIDKKSIENVLNGNYNLKTPKMHTDKSYKELIIAGLMDMPLDSVEVGDDIAAVLASPYITKRAETENEIGMSRFDFIKNAAPLDKEYTDTFNKMNEIYTREMSVFANQVLDSINEKLDELPNGMKLSSEEGRNSSVLGKYLIPIIAPEIAKFSIIKSIDPNAKITVNPKNGEISYDYKKLKQTSLAGLGIIADSPKDEANQLLNLIKKRISKLSSKDKTDFTNAILLSLRGVNLDSYKLAEMIIDKSEAGLDWRIDATKDIADINAMKDKKMHFEGTWDTIINFWKKFNDNVISENRNAYIAAEVTDAHPLLMEEDKMPTPKFSNGKEAERQLLNQAGFTTMANYGYFFTDLAQIFAKKTETGEPGALGDVEQIFKLLVGNSGFLRSASLPALQYSYNVIDNHDVPRALHCMAMDMQLFYYDFRSNKNKPYKELAYRLIKNDFGSPKITDEMLNSVYWPDVSNKAVAMADSLNRGFGKGLVNIYGNSSRQKEMWEKIAPSITDLANGKFKGKTFEAEGFGVKPFDMTIKMVIDQAISEHGLHLANNDERLKLEKEILKVILEPAMTKYLGLMKFLVALPGNPTLYAGDELGATGYETKTKNIYLQNRNYLHNEWVDSSHNDYRDYIAKKKEDRDILFSLRKRPELHALNDGAPFMLNTVEGTVDNSSEKAKITGILRHSTDGAMAISLFNTKGVHNNYDQNYSPFGVTIESIDLGENNPNKQVGLPSGIKPGAIFVDAYDKNNKFVVCESDGKYYIRHYNGYKKDDSPVYIKDSILVLYHMPGMQAAVKEEYTPSFKGRKILYNPQYNFVSNPYSQPKNVSLGSNLMLTSK